MKIDLSAELLSVADYLDRAVDPVDAEEVMSRHARSGLVGPVDDLDPTDNAHVDRRSIRRPRTFAVVSAAAFIAASVVVAVALKDDTRVVSPTVDRPPTTGANPGRASSAVPPTNASVPVTASSPSTVAMPAVSAPDDTSTQADSVGGASSDGATLSSLSFDQLAEQVRIAQHSVDSFRAVVTVDNHTDHPDGSTTIEASGTSTETYFADGSSWSESTDGSWASYDADAGISRSATVKSDGSTAFRLAHNEPDNNRLRQYLQISATTTAPGWTFTIEDTTQLDRPVWRLASRAPETGEITHTEVIDRQTGITIEFVERYVVDGTTTVMQWKFESLEVGAALPDAFPGVVPADTPVSPSRYTQAAGPLTLEQAAAIYGADIYAPDPLPADARVWLLPLTAPDHTNLQVRISLSAGMATREIWMSDIGSGVAPAVGPQVLTSGALLGHVSGLGPTSVQMVDGHATIDVTGLDQADALAIANSLTRVPSSASTIMTTDRTLYAGQPFTMTLTGRLRDQRGGYLWLRTATGTNIALLRSDGNPEIPIGYTLDTAAFDMLDDGLSGDSSTFIIPPTVTLGQYLLCTANSGAEECIPVEVRPT